MVVKGRGKLGYLLGTLSKPDSKDPAFETWDANNNIVMSWLINSMTEKIQSSCLYYSSAAELWNYLNLAYSDLDNSTQVFELRNAARNLLQGEADVTEYYTSLVKIRQELDLHDDCSMACATCTKKYQDRMAKERAYDFLAGLNRDLDEVRGRLLGIKPLPCIEEIFSEVRREESRKRVMLGSNKSDITAPESSALVSHRNDHNKAIKEENRGQTNAKEISV
ncbi:uncharacterized protein LOC130137618 [Syzygium oleosum]|uniref:uncharacterized protein LOC130137618 n=1 Tax=Syzygium oleosum TaxID=219896 RepID=UPI0024B98D39|nr:uncharacterized protein LOC130137618 [Syzygium oleosum]